MMLSAPLAARALPTTCAMSSGARNWPFLMLTGRPAARHRLDEIGLPAQERRRLQHVDDARRGRHFVDRVDVGQHGHADLPLDLGEHVQALVDAGSAEARVRAAIRLVVRRLEDERHAERRADLLQDAGHVELQLQRLDHARTGDQEHRPLEADVESAELHRRLKSSPRARRCPPRRRARAPRANRAPRARSSRTADGRGADST